MPSSYGRAVVAAVFVFALIFSPYAHAAEATALTINDPFTDAIQLWSGILISIGTFANQLAAEFSSPHKVLSTGTSQKLPARKYPPQQAILPASAPLAAESLFGSVTSSKSYPLHSNAAQQVLPRSPPNDATTTTADIGLAPAASTSAFVTKSELQSQLQLLTNHLSALIVESVAGNSQSTFPENVAADGNGSYPYAAANAINNLSNVTITNANLTASEIPALDYLSLDGGSLAGDLLINGNATTSDLFASSILSNNISAGTFSSSGTSTLANIILSNLNCSTYGNGGKLTTDGLGNVICSADQSGGAGSTVAGSNGQIQFNGFGSFGATSELSFATSTGTLTAPTVSSANSSTTNATSTALFSALANFSSAVATTFNASVANITGLTYVNGTSTNATTTDLYAGSAVIPSLSATNATTTSLGIDGQTFTNLLGTGLSNTAGTLAVSLSPFTTSNLTEGSNLYFTNNRAASVIAGTTTDALAEGTNNKYFTNARAQSAISVSGAPLTYSSGVIGINQANDSQSGFLGSADWNIFNDKVSSTSLSGAEPITYNSSTGAIGFDFTRSNSWTGTQGFANISAANATTTSLYITGITGELLKSDANGQIAAAVAGTDYQAPITAGNLTAGSNLTVTGGTDAVIGSGASISLGSSVVTGVTNDTNVTGSISANSLTLGWTGLLGVTRGGTGSSTLSGILKGNGTGALQTAVGGTDYEFPLTFSAPLSRLSNTISISQANGATNGYLVSADWNTFNNKVGSTSLSAIYPLAYNSSNGVFSLGFGTTTNNTFSGSNVFNGNTTFTNATSSTLAISDVPSSLLSTNANGSIVATTSVGVNYLSGILSIANGGTGIGSQTTNRVEYYNGTGITAAANWAYDGTTSVLTASSANTSGNVYGLEINGTQSAANAPNNYYGLYATPTYTATGTQNGFAGILSKPTNTGTGTISNFSGLVTTPQNTAAGTTALMYGVLANPANTGAGTTTSAYGVSATPQQSGTGSITNEFALYAQCANSNASGTVTNCYEDYLDTPVETGPITASWGVYQKDINSNNYFNGNVGIGTTTPWARLSIAPSSSSAGSPQIVSWVSGSTTPSFIVSSANNNGYIGIGTTTPGSILSINGVGNFVASATSTLYNGLSIASGCVSVNGTCLGTGGVTSVTGTANQITASASTGAITLSLPTLVDLTNASSSVLSVSGEGFFGTASTTNLIIGTPSALLSSNSSGSVISTTVSSPLSFSSNTLSIPQATGSQNGFLSSPNWTTFNGKLSSTSLATSALIAGLVSDETGSGQLVFATSPTFAGTPVFSGGVVSYSANSTTTIPNNTVDAYTVATSTTGAPLIEVDTTSGSETVSVGSADASAANVEIGAAGQQSSLIFAGTSTIEGSGIGQTITIGANSDIIDFGVNVGIGSSSPSKLLTLDHNFES